MERRKVGFADETRFTGNQMKSLIALYACAAVLQGQALQVEQAMSRPEYRNSRFAIEVYSLDNGEAFPH